jgi:hypothetical protein
MSGAREAAVVFQALYYSYNETESRFEPHLEHRRERERERGDLKQRLANPGTREREETSNRG